MLQVFICVNLLESSTQGLALACIFLFGLVCVLDLSLLAHDVRAIVLQVRLDDHVLNAFHILLHVSVNIEEEGVWMKVALLLWNCDVFRL